MTMALADLPRGQSAHVVAIVGETPDDAVARRLRDLGFVAGEVVRVAALGPFGREPMVVQIGFTRFALRRAEAARVRVRPRAGGEC